MSENSAYKFLERRPGSNYQQLFVKGRRIRAEVLYRETIGEEPRTPEEVACDFDLPLEVVREAIDYCIQNQEFLHQEREQEEVEWQEFEKKIPAASAPKPMKIYLDDNRIDRVIVGMLRKAGHSVVTPADAGLSGRSDTRHLEFAIRNGLEMFTADRRDFKELHELVLTSGGSHPGILDNDPKRDMRPRHMVAAIAKLERAGVDLRNQIIVLNHWR